MANTPSSQSASKPRDLATHRAPNHDPATRNATPSQRIAASASSMPRGASNICTNDRRARARGALEPRTVRVVTLRRTRDEVFRCR
jgi:hypothetical protein